MKSNTNDNTRDDAARPAEARIDLSAQIEKVQSTARAQRQAEVAEIAHQSPNEAVAESDALPWPPGFAGQLATFLFQSSYTPVREVAIAATLGVLAGVCGRAYRTHTEKDLALYIILVARSGIGKDGIHDGIPKLLRQARVPLAELFLRQMDFASGQALQKEIIRSPGFLHLKGEFGRSLKRMGNPQDVPMQFLRTVMTDVYAKPYYEGRSYSDAENTLLGVPWPAYSFLGETTPGTFLESLTPDMMEDGFMSRFLVISHAGLRPMPNEARISALSPEQTAYWKALLEHAIRYQPAINAPEALIVGFKNEDAYERLKRFELECRDRINAIEDESERQAWNRAHIKALKIAGLLAVADSFGKPQIDLGHAVWALTTVRTDINTFQSRKATGDVGTGDHARERKVGAWIKAYLMKGAPAGYKIPEAMRADGIIPRKFLQVRTSSSSPFTSHKLGANAALDLALKSMVDSGYLMEVPRARLRDEYNFQGRCYGLLNLPG